jgi:hypothetical protein
VHHRSLWECGSVGHRSLCECGSVGHRSLCVLCRECGNVAVWVTEACVFCVENVGMWQRGSQEIVCFV